MPVYSFDGKTPEIAASAYVSPSATVIGQVAIGERCYVGHGAILRGDYGNIEIGDESAVEEGVIIHARPQDWTRIGRRVTLGHGAMVHNATIEEGAVIGMRAVVSDFAVVGQGSIVGEMGLVKRNQTVPPNKVAVGVPVKVVDDVDDRHQAMTHWGKDLYVSLAERYAAGALVEIGHHFSSPFYMLPIGVIRTPFRTTEEAPAQGIEAPDAEGEIVLDSRFKDGLTGLGRCSQITVVCTFHQSKGHELSLVPRGESSHRGVFATRAPRRPNPIGITVVQLLGIDGCCLRVRGVDMLDGTPVLDIKPYLAAVDAVGEKDES